MLPVNTELNARYPKVRMLASPILSYSDPSYDSKQINIVIIRQQHAMTRPCMEHFFKIHIGLTLTIKILFTVKPRKAYTKRALKSYGDIVE